MGKLTAADRKGLSPSEFAGPNRSFPINDKVHAIKAEQLAPRAEAAGHITAAQEHAIVDKAHSREQQLSDHMVAHHKRMMG